MADNPEPTEPGQPNQSTHLGQYRYHRCEEPKCWDDEWDLFPHSALVQAKDWAIRQHPNFTCVSLAR